MKWEASIRLTVHTTAADRLRAWRKMPIWHSSGQLDLDKQLGRQMVIREYLEACFDHMDYYGEDFRWWFRG